MQFRCDDHCCFGNFLRWLFIRSRYIVYRVGNFTNKQCVGQTALSTLTSTMYRGNCYAAIDRSVQRANRVYILRAWKKKKEHIRHNVSQMIFAVAYRSINGYLYSTKYREINRRRSGTRETSMIVKRTRWKEGRKRKQKKKCIASGVSCKRGNCSRLRGAVIGDNGQ